ncbi:MAG TPA: uroporphyrinogen-III C-methyltransferase [Methylomirabilota bacterium]|jgi:uroporphyrin-III C-methyltransferase/precorrin-2 dehydrogenase/sirohydrochlorin ferrochelatase|nr:uroporphyrinogen-III C-methyltransferase [Methylomirabilota bacterium]
MRGFVSLVGAGPGDPELLTRKAAWRLAEADLVLYDALVSPDALDLAPPRAQRFLVGKRAGRPSVKQDTIHRLMIRGARRGKRVVRLKCGDPFVLGRGGEEALALAAAGIPFEVIPGLTTAVAAPALSGIPVTHRGIASAFLVVSGHAETAYGPILDSLPPHSLTLVILMGLASRDTLTDLLIARGWDPATPAAVCLASGTPDASSWIGTLDTLGAATVGAEHGSAPGTIVIGDVVSIGATLTAAIPARAAVLAAS